MKRIIIALALFSIIITGCGTPKPAEPVVANTPPNIPSPTPAQSYPTAKEPETPKTVNLKPLPVLPLPAEVKEISTPPEAYSRLFTWEYAGKTWQWETKFSEGLYTYFRGLPRPQTQNYSVYVTHKADDAIIDFMASELVRVAQAEGLDKLQTAELAAAFVQRLQYMLDTATKQVEEYPRYPVETLVDNCGDCDDKSSLLAALLDRMGYKVVMIIFPGKHGAIGITNLEGAKGTSFKYNEDDYYYIETTDSGWEVGQIPDQYKGLDAIFFEMKPVPILTHYFNASGSGSTLNVDVTVDNEGTADAQDVSVTVGFDDGQGKIINSKECAKFNLAQGGKNAVFLSMTPPSGKHTRLVIEVKNGTESASKSYSDWFDTP